MLAVFAMERALITRDFDVQYVAEVGSHRTPALYNVAALWSSLEGSILLWHVILVGVPGGDGGEVPQAARRPARRAGRC